MVAIRRIELYSGSWSLKYKIIDLVNPWGLLNLKTDGKAAYNNGCNNKRKTNFN
jgi:hypothetical protein